MNVRLFDILIVLLSATLIFSGCSEKEPVTPETSGGGSSIGGIDLTTSISELKTAAANMDLSDLEEKAKQYMEQIQEKKAALEKLTEQLKAIPLAEKMGEEAKDLQNKITELTSTMSDLTRRFQVYVDAITEKGGDISQFTLS